MTVARILCLVLALPAASSVASPALQPAALQSAVPAADAVSSRISVKLPHPATELTVDGQKLEGSGESRTIDSPRLRRGAQGTMTIAA
jgi:hypothetical protein